MKARKKAPDKTAHPVHHRPLSVKVLTEAIPNFTGNLAAVARSFGITRSSVWDYIQSHPQLKVLVQDGRESRVDTAESALDEALDRGEPWAVTLTLKTLGKDRGYIERTEHEHSGTLVKKKIVVEIVHAPSSADAGPPGGRTMLPAAPSPS